MIELPDDELPAHELPDSELPDSELPVSQLPDSELPESELTGDDEFIVWGHPALTLVLAIPPDAPVSVVRIGALDTSAAGSPGPSASPLPSQPVTEIRVAGEGRDSTGSRTVLTTVGRRMRYTSHESGRDGDWLTLLVRQHDPVSGLSVELRLRTPDGVPAVRAETQLVNDGSAALVVEAVTSLCVGGLLNSEQIDGGSVLIGASEWLAESRWALTGLRTGGLPDISIAAHGQDPRGSLSRSSRGAWSSGTSMPTAGLIGPAGERAWLWQIEHNGSWEWEIGEQAAGVWLSLSGPRDDAHGWNVQLTPGESCTSVPVALALGTGLDGVAATMTDYRRLIRAAHSDRERLPLIYNDYMNTLNGDPTTQRLVPLIDAAASVGAEVFCIDAGWYDDGGDWWDSVGEWQPSKRRFEHGLSEVLDRIRDHGMVAGLWLEPEVIGVRSAMVDALPSAAFFHRHGARVREHGRYHLDLRHPAARAHLDATVDRLVGELGVGYFKFDYNIDPGVGTDLGGRSAGEGLLEHNRAYLDWLDGLLQRHPDLILENCASGGLRSDYALLSRLHLQSTSDQQDPLRYPPIAAGAPLSILPEQAASWAYPQPQMSPEEVAFTLATGLTGRFYLSGHLNQLDQPRRELVEQAVALWRETRGWLAGSAPLWPLGLPGWEQPWIAAGLRHGRDTLDTRLVLTRRPGGSNEIDLALPHLRGHQVRVDHVFPHTLPAWTCSWDADSAVLHVIATTEAPSARVLAVSVP